MSGDATDLLTGAVASGESDEAAKKYLNKVTGAYDGIQTPVIDPLNFHEEKWLGDVSPATVNQGEDVQFSPVAAAQSQAALAGPSAMAGITDNPAMLSQEQASLGALQDLADKGGLNTTDAANLNRIQGAAAQQSRGQQDAIMQSMASRGAGGSGNELLARLSASQNATNQASQQGLDVAGQAQSRALQAMMQGGSLASQLQGQQFGEAAQKASAQDAIAKFNAAQSQQNNQYNTAASNSMGQYNATQGLNTALNNRTTNLGVQQANAGATNNANYYNNQGRQGVANTNTGINNQQDYYNSNTAKQQNFNNQTTLAGAKSSAAKTGLDYEAGQSNQERAAFGNAVGGAAAIAAAAHGGFVPGHASRSGDSFANDKIPTMLSPGEVVLPRSVTMAAHPTQAAKSFLQHPHSIQMPGKTHTPTIKPENLAEFLRKINPARVTNNNLTRAERGPAGLPAGEDSGDPGTEDALTAKLAALGLLSK